MRTVRFLVAALCGLTLWAAATSAQASRPLLSHEAIKTSAGPPVLNPPPDGQIEGACGVTATSGGLFVSEYYRHRVDLFTLSGATSLGQIAAPNPLDGVCGLAHFGAAIYANEWHGSVLRLSPSVKVYDAGHQATGVAVDNAGNVYSDDREYVAVYEPSGEPVLDEGQPLKIGLGSLGEGFGVAVGGGRVYVADAAAGNVKVYEPAVDPAEPVSVIDPGFESLVDSSLAIDPTNGHLLVVDNLQPGFETPEAAVFEFDSDGTLLDRFVPGIVDGAPSGLAADDAGNLFVTTGNTEGSNLLKFGPYVADSASALASSLRGTASSAAASSAGSATVGAAPEAGKREGTSAEIIQRNGVRVAVEAKLKPKKLPRKGTAPVRFSLSANISSTDESFPPQLRRLEIEINRHGHINSSGLPVCHIEDIQPSTTAGALHACRDSLVGEGSFSAKVLLTQQAPFPSVGKVVAFNGIWHGKPAILAHIFGTQPVPTSFSLPFVIGTSGKGVFGASLTASLPHFTSKWGYVTGLSLNLGRSLGRGAHRHSYLTAGCPAPPGFNSTTFSVARTQLSFGDGGPRSIEQALTGTCGVR